MTDLLKRVAFTLKEHMNGNDDSHLTERELEIIGLLMHGYSSKEIAAKLYISKHTVDTHRRHIIRKTGLRNLMEVVVQRLQEGMHFEKGLG
jgi:DNA-binding CsgD family transcriptional regulator